MIKLSHIPEIAREYYAIVNPDKSLYSMYYMKTNRNIKHVILDLDQTITIDQGPWLQFTQLLGTNPDIHTDIFNKYRNRNKTL